jgi:RimJ/RimL family protein N-acetyltransferase
MTFMKTDLVELRVLEADDSVIFTKAVNAGLTTEHLFTGSVPMRTKDYAARWEDERKAGDVLFGIWIRGGLVDPAAGILSADRFIGTCGLHSHRDIYKSWEARFLIFDPHAVGQGIGKDVVRLLTDYAFQRLNAHRVWLGVSEANRRAVKCYLDCGYVFEGRERDAIFYQGRYFATLKMSVLEDEWTSITTAKA